MNERIGEREQGEREVGLIVEVELAVFECGQLVDHADGFEQRGPVHVAHRLDVGERRVLVSPLLHLLRAHRTEEIRDGGGWIDDDPNGRGVDEQPDGAIGTRQTGSPAPAS